jgi:hypothetical protein
MTYGAGRISSFTDLPMNSTENQIFTANTSASMGIEWSRYYVLNSSLNYGVDSLEFQVNNTSDVVKWQANFTNRAVFPGNGESYELSNYSITWWDVPTDWNQTNANIYENDSLRSMAINIKDRNWTLINSTSKVDSFLAYEYCIETTAPNYISAIDLMNKTTRLTETFRGTNVIVESDFHPNAIPSSGTFNISVYFTGNNSMMLTNNSQIPQIADIMNQTIWLAPSGYPNGSWQIIATYLNGTEVGIRKHDLLILTNTSLSIERIDSPVAIDTDLNVTVRFWDVAQNAGVSAAGVNVTVIPDWTDAHKKISSTGIAGYYSTLINTSEAELGEHNVTIYANFIYHLNCCLPNQPVTLVRATRLSIPLLIYGSETYNLSKASPSLNFTDSFTISVNYTEADGSPIPGASVKLTSALMGVSKIEMDTTDNRTHFITLNTMENATGNYMLNISATAPYHASQDDEPRNFEIKANPTNFTAWTHLNNTETTAVYYHPYQPHTFFLQWEDCNHNELIDATSVEINSSKVTQVANATTGGHTFEFLPNATGSYAQNAIEIRLSRMGYESLTYKVTFNVQETPTGLGEKSTYSNDTELSRYYTDQTTFNISWNDTIHNTIIAGGNTPVFAGNGSSYVTQNSHGEGNYSFTFDAAVLGRFVVIITLTKANYTSLDYHLVFIINSNPTILQNLSPADNNTVITWDKTVAASLTWNDTYHNELISGATLVFGPGNATYIESGAASGGTYPFIINGRYLGVYWFKITLSKYGYANQTFLVRIQVNQSPTDANPQWPSGITTIQLSYTDSYTFWVQWQDTDGTQGSDTPVWINDTDGPSLNDSFVSYQKAQSNPANGNHTFVFNEDGTLLPGLYIIGITLGNLTHANTLYELLFYVDYASTALIEYSYVNGSSVMVAYSDSLEFYIRWQDVNHTDWLESPNPPRGDLELRAAPTNGTHTFRFNSGGSKSTTSWYYTIILNVTGNHGYEPYVYHITFIVTENPTQITNWSDKPINESSVIFGQISNFWVEWSDMNHSIPISGASVTVSGNGSMKVQELTHSGGTYQFLFVGNQKAFFEVYIQLNLSGYSTAMHSLNFSVIAANTEISNSKAQNNTAIYLRYGDDYPFWLLWNDTDNNALIEDLTPGISESSHVTLMGQPASGNHSFLFTATELGSFPVTITLDVAGYQIQHYVLTFEVESNPTAFSTWTIAPGSEQDVAYSGSFAFSFTWEDTNHSIAIESATVSNNETTYVAEGPHSGGNYFFVFSALVLGTYGVNITLTTTGYDTLSYLVTFHVVKSATELAGWQYANDSTVQVSYGDAAAFWLIWKDLDHNTFIIDPNPYRNPSTYLSFEGSDAAAGNHSFQFIHATERTPGTYIYTIALNETGYEPLVYHITFEVLVNPTEITDWFSRPSNATTVTFSQTYDFWVVWTDLNHGVPIPGGSVLITGTGSAKIQELAHAGGTYQFRFTGNQMGFFDVQIQLSLAGYDPASHAFNFTVGFKTTEIADSLAANASTIYLRYSDTFLFWLLWKVM